MRFCIAYLRRFAGDLVLIDLFVAFVLFVIFLCEERRTIKNKIKK